MRRFRGGSAVLFTLAAMAGVNSAHGQGVLSVNGLKVIPYNFHLDANSTLTITDKNGTPVNPPPPANSTLPLAGGAVIDERDYVPANAVNRHDLQLSSDGGATARLFALTTESFDISFDLMLDVGASPPVKEAGFIFASPMGGGQFIVKTNGEIAAFDGPFPFYRFNDRHQISFADGETVNLGIVYKAGLGTVAAPSTIEYRVNEGGSTTFSSGPIKITNLENSLFNNTKITAYVQGAGGSASDFSHSEFTNFKVALPTDADFDDDNDVDGADFLSWQRGYGITTGAMPSQGDADGNGAVNNADYAAWSARFGTRTIVVPPPAIHGVPEPTALALAGLAIVGATALRRSARQTRRG